MKILVGLIKNNLRNANLINTRFILVDDTKRTCDDVTEEICAGVNEAKISKFTYRKGLAVYKSNNGLADNLNNFNIGKINTLDLKNCEISMFTKDDVKRLFGCKNVFDKDILNIVFSYIHNKETAKRKKFLIKERKANIDRFKSILNGEHPEYKKYMDDEVFIKDVKSRLELEEKLLKDLI